MRNDYFSLVSSIQHKKLNRKKLSQLETIFNALYRTNVHNPLSCTYFSEKLHITQYNARICELRRDYDIPIFNHWWFEEINGEKVKRSNYWVDFKKTRGRSKWEY